MKNKFKSVLTSTALAVILALPYIAFTQDDCPTCPTDQKTLADDMQKKVDPILKVTLNKDDQIKANDDFMSAVQGLNLAAIKMALMKGANINTVTEGAKRTALFYLICTDLACPKDERAKKTEIMKYLLDHDPMIDVNIQDTAGVTIGMTAARYYDPTAIDLIFNDKYKAKSDLRDRMPNNFGSTALLSVKIPATSTEEKLALDCVKAFIKNKIPITQKDLRGDNLVMIAALDNGKESFIKNLHQLGFKIDEPDKDNISPLMILSGFNSLDLIKYFVETGKAQINRVSPDNGTALDYAIEGNNTDVIKYLRSKGAKTAAELKK